MHGPINVKSPNYTSEWQMGYNLAFKGLSIITVLRAKNFNLEIPESKAELCQMYRHFLLWKNEDGVK
jgi:hypothetical protein